MASKETTFTLTVATPHGVIYEHPAHEVVFTTRDGQITVFPHHTPLVSVLMPGEMIVREGVNEYYFVVSGGILEIRESGNVLVLADTSERLEDVDLERAEAARIRAEEALKERHTLDDVTTARFQAKLARDLARVQVGRRRRKT